MNLRGWLSTLFAALLGATLCGGCNLVIGLGDVPSPAEDGSVGDASVADTFVADATVAETAPDARPEAAGADAMDSHFDGPQASMDAHSDGPEGSDVVDATDVMDTSPGDVTVANPCDPANSGCSTNSTCMAVDAGARTCTCNMGYSGDGLTCTAINACLTNNGGCSPNATCTKTGPNMRSCACNAGYTGDGLTCTGVQACATNNGGCAATAKCTSTGPNIRTCTCNQGYSGDGMTCTPINSCATGNGGCSASATCAIAGPGTNTCACNTGYTGDGVTCTPINPCSSNNGGCSPNALCKYTGPGTNTCTCNSGYAGNGATCTPINLCSTSNGGCSVNALCTYTGPGTDTCTCNAGYAGNGMTCTPINLCSTSNGGCSVHSTCTYTGPGQRTCMCNTDPYCRSTSTACANTTAYVPCSQDSAGCFFASATPTSCGAGMQCSNGTCLLLNGQPCTTSGSCLSNTCSTFYIDQDGDSHGWAATTRRVCGTAAPAGYVTSSDDCCDLDGNTFPGQTQWFASASTACPSHNGWDYNCDGVNELEWTEVKTTSCVPNDQTLCPSSCTCPVDLMWFMAPVPDCGMVSSQVLCANVVFSAPDGWHCNDTINDAGVNFWDATQACH